MSEFNLPLLRKAIEWAESEASKPEAESEWCQRHFATAGEDIARTCGTAYCIAGHIAHEDGGHDLSAYRIDGDPRGEAAQELLGIDDRDAWGAGMEDAGLFCGRNTIEDVRRYAEKIARRYGEEL